MNIFTNKTEWSQFNEQEMADYKAAIFAHYRTVGYPYFFYSDEEKTAQLHKLIAFPHEDLIDGQNVRQTMHGLGLAWSYHPHHIDVRCNGMRTVRETFEDDHVFRKVIDKRIRYSDSLTDNSIRKGLRVHTGTQGVSNFRPTAAAAIYHRFMPNGGTTWDMSSGYSGRLLGAFACDKVSRYIGTDPCALTFAGLQATAADIKRLVPERKLVVELHQLGSELFVPEAGSIDLCFTSPPYFDTERYSDEDTQSYKKYPGREQWLYGFMAETLENCRTALKAGGVLAINVEDTKCYPGLCYELVRHCQTTGWNWIDTMPLQLSRMMGGKHKGSFKYEPIFIFVKEN